MKNIFCFEPNSVNKNIVKNVMVSMRKLRLSENRSENWVIRLPLVLLWANFRLSRHAVWL